jgi:GNAT superfamily N-acetyltransferase
MSAEPLIGVVGVPVDSPAAASLVAELQEEYVAVYGGPDETPMAPDEFVPPDGAFLVLSRDGEVAGCAGLRRHDGTTAEMKRVFVRESRRGQGLGRVLLTAVEERARELGYRRIVLESGDRLWAALELYRSAGYTPIEPFGIYASSPSSRYLGRDL